MRTCVALLSILFAALIAIPASACADELFAQIVQPFFKQHCIACHSEHDPQSQIRFDKLSEFLPRDRNLWTMIHEQIESGTMPPEGKPRPGKDDTKKLLDWIGQKQRTHNRSGTRRLNRRELSAALQDVTGLSAEFAYALPGDGKVNGFDTGAEGLQDAADSVAQTMVVARRAVDGIRFLDPASGKLYAANVRDAKDIRKVFDAWKDDGLKADAGEVVSQPSAGWFIKPKWLGDRGGLTIRLPPPENRNGIVRVRLVVSVKKFVDGVPNPHLWVEVGGRDIAYLEIANVIDEPRTLDFQVLLGDVTIDNKGLAITLTNRVEMPYACDGFPNEDRSKPDEKIPGGTGLWRPQFDPKSTAFEKQPVPFVVLHSFEIETDYRVLWPPAGRVEDRELADNPESAARLLKQWMERAWRRPIAESEQTRFLALYEKLRGQGESFDQALRGTFQSVLLSGSFRYLSPADKNDAQMQFALASRLSFMLWGAPPDAELRRLAAANKLLERAVLDAQIDRLLADPRSDGFFRPFVTQWLEMGQPITLAMDHIQKQDYRFGRNLKASMQEESIAYVRELVQHNRPARELLSSNWTMLNDILARHYGYENIAGGHLRRVTLRPDDPRGGGLLGQAGIQSMLCWMGDNWVIYRGAWTLRRILDDPPPPPPLEVPELLPSDGQNQGKTFRQLLQQHQEDAKCTVCHKKMDPLGFAFQNFDLSGRWREREFEKYVKNDLDGKIEWRGTGKDRPVDAVGKLPRGEAFESFAEAKTLLVKHYTDDLVRCLLKNLVLYGGSYEADVTDLAQIRQIMADTKLRDYPLHELLRASIRSRTISTF